LFSGKSKIVLVEDDKGTLAVLKSIVSDLGAEVINFTSAAPALEYISEHDDVKVLVTDINMPEMPGDVLVREVLQSKPWIDTFIITGTHKMNNAIPTYMAGAREIFLKPISKATLNPHIQESLKRHQRWTAFLKQIKK
jgi:two-component system chemotaxis response regulator CheY